MCEGDVVRSGEVIRNTQETQITASVALDGKGVAAVDTGIGFFDHMLDQLARHSGIDLAVKAVGDLHVDAHHTVEDTGYAVGEAILHALGDKRGINRYGHAYIPMDETLSRAVVDFCGRPYLVWRVPFPTDKVGSLDLEVFREFFLALATAMRANLHIENIYGVNSHHIIESCYKAVAKAIKQAKTIDTHMADVLPTTKGAL